MSLRIAPPSSHPSTTSNTNTSKLAAQTPSSSSSAISSKGAPSAPGLPDLLRADAAATPNSSASAPLTSTHPLEARLASWTATQETLKHNVLRRTYGLGEPIRRGMELKLVRDADYQRPDVLGRPSGVHEDILTGRDAEITWEDVYTGEERGVVRDGEDRRGGVLGGIERGVGMGEW